MIPIAILAILLIAFVALILTVKESVNYQKYYRNGLQQEKAGDLNGAIQEYEHALKLYPSHIDSLLHLAVIYPKVGSTSEVVNVYNRLLDLTDTGNIGNMVKIHTRLANLYEEYGLYDRAYLECLKSIEFEENDMHKLHIARFLTGCGEYDAALNSLRSLVKSTIPKSQIYFLMGVCYASKGWLNESVVEFERCLGEAPDTVAASMYLGYINKDKMSIKAIEHFNDVILKSSNDDQVQEASLLCGMCCIEHAFYEKASRIFKTRLKKEDEITPLGMEIHYNLGWAYLLSGDIGNALNEWGIVANHDMNFLDVAMLLKNPEDVDFEAQEIEWRRYSSNKNFKTGKEYIGFRNEWDVAELEDEFEKWKNDFDRRRQRESSGDDIKFSSALAYSRAPADVFRKTARKIVGGLNYDINTESRQKSGIDYYCKHRKDEVNMVLISFRTWTHPIGVEEITEIRTALKSQNCARAILMTCGEIREKAKEMAKNSGIKLVNQLQLTHILKKL